MVAMLVPVRQGVDDLAVWAGVGFAVAAVLAFRPSPRRPRANDCRTDRRRLERRGRLARRLRPEPGDYGIDIAAVGLAVDPLVFVAFVTAGLTAGVGVAESLGIGLVGFKRRAQQLAVLTGVGFAGLFAPK